MTPLEYLELWAIVCLCGWAFVLCYLGRRAWLRLRHTLAIRRYSAAGRRDLGSCRYCGHLFAMQNSNAADKRSYCTEEHETRDLYAHFV